MVRKTVEKINTVRKMIKSRYMQLEQSYKYVKKITKKNKDDM